MDDGSMKTEALIWKWNGKSIDLAMNWCGDGPTVLLLPALSSISTRHEMRPLQEHMSAKFRTVSTDWPGFGDLGGGPRCHVCNCSRLHSSKLVLSARSIGADLARAVTDHDERTPTHV